MTISSYQRLKEKLQFHQSIEQSLRECVISLLVDQIQNTGKVKLPIFGREINPYDISDLGCIESNYFYDLINEAQRRC